jgi:hypothetical protein
MTKRLTTWLRLTGKRLGARLTTKLLITLLPRLPRLPRMMTRLTRYGRWRRSFYLGISKLKCDILHIFLGQRTVQGFPDNLYCRNWNGTDSIFGFHADILLVDLCDSACYPFP